jgi:hypothetical protein
VSAIELASASLVEQVSRLVDGISQGTAEEAKTAYDRLGMAREWAKLQDDAAILAERLVWLEAVILRRIGELDQVRVLPSARRAAARHFAHLDDAELSSLLESFPARSAVSSFNLWARSEGIRRRFREGMEVVSGTPSPDGELDADPRIATNLRLAIQERITSVRQAAAVILDEYATFAPVTVMGVVDEFIAEEAPLPDSASDLEVTAFRKGLAAAVREAFVGAPLHGMQPSHITTFRESSGEWLRIPSEFATVGDARQMLELRRGQVESAQRSLAELEEWAETIWLISDRPPTAWLREDHHARDIRRERQERTA